MQDKKVYIYILEDELQNYLIVLEAIIGDVFAEGKKLQDLGLEARNCQPVIFLLSCHFYIM